MDIKLSLTDEQTAGLESATAVSNIGSKSPLSAEEFLVATIQSTLESFVSARANARRAKIAEAFASQPIEVQEKLLSQVDWTSIVDTK